MRISAAIAVGLLLSLQQLGRGQKIPAPRGDVWMTIKRVLPPAVNLAHKRIWVLSEAQGGVSPDIATVLQTRVVTAIQRDPSFIIDKSHPETHLSVTITAFRVEPVRIRDAGNSSAGCMVFVGRADVSYQAIEVQTGIPQDSENLSWTIEANKPPHPSDFSLARLAFPKPRLPGCSPYGDTSQSEASDELYDELVQQVTQRAAPVVELIEVWLPGGKAKDLSAIAKELRWAALIEKAEQRAKMPRPEDEADRLYLIALGHEALAYDARRQAWELERRHSQNKSEEERQEEGTLFNSSKEHLELAAEYYRQAIGLDSKRDELKAPEARIEYAVRLYATILWQRNEYEARLEKAIAEGKLEGIVAHRTPPSHFDAKGPGTGGLLPRIPGFGSGTKVTIKRLLPPAVDLVHKRIAVSAEGQGGVSAEVVNVFKNRVVSAIQRDPNFVIDEKNPQTRLSFKITTFRVEPLQTTTAGTPPTNCNVFVGRADISYQAIEVKTGVAQDSEYLSWTIGANKTDKASLSSASALVTPAQGLTASPAACGAGKTSAGEASDELFAAIVNQVTQRAAPVDATIEVWLPGGRLKNLSAIAQQQRWSVLIEKAEETPRMEKLDDEAGRLYLIALAHEALAYEARREAWDLERARRRGQSGGDNSQDEQQKEAALFKTAKEHLDQAAEFYKQAAEDDSKSIALKAPEPRIEYAVRLYATIERQHNEYAANLQKQSADPAKMSAASPSSMPRRPNDEVLKLCEAKLDEATILDFIKSPNAPKIFDVSVNAMLAMKPVCGDSTGRYIAAMRAKAARPKTTPPKPTSIPPP